MGKIAPRRLINRMKCQRGGCERKVLKPNPYSVCHACLPIIETVAWMLEVKLLGPKEKTPLERMGLVTP